MFRLTFAALLCVILQLTTAEPEIVDNGVIDAVLVQRFLHSIPDVVADANNVTNASSSVDNRQALPQRRPVDWGRVFDAALDVYTPDSAVLGDSLCRAHGQLFRQGVKQGQLWALHMLDASSKLPSGLLTGNLVQLGNVEQCLAVSHVDPVHGPITGQHCLVSLGVSNAMSKLLISDKMSAGSFNSTGLDTIELLLSQRKFGDALDLVGATWSLCVPASCSPGDLERHLRAALPGRLQVRVEDLACGTKATLEDRPWSLEARIMGLLLGCLLMAITVGTGYDLLTDADDDLRCRNQHLVALSLYTNGLSLLKTSTNSGTLSSFDGLRCISILWTTLIHYLWFQVNSPLVNSRSLVAMSRDWTHLIVTNGSFGVDSMFVISGALVTFNFLRDRELNVKFSWWRFYLDRYVRLTPTSLVMLLFTWMVVTDMGNTPTERINGVHLASSCATYGWLNPLYLTNYFDHDHTCLCQVWSTSVDMHLYWISPLLLFPLWRKPRLGLSLLLALSGAGVVLVYVEAYRVHLPPFPFILSSPDSVLMNELYFKTQLRATPWLIGVALGYLLHVTKNKQKFLSPAQTFIGWTASVLLTSYAFLSAHAYYQPDAKLERVATAIYIATMRPAWALGVAWVLFACQRGKGGFVNAFLSWSGWQVPSKLCFAVSFTHFTLAMGLTVIKKTPEHHSDLQALFEFLGMVVASIAAGIVLHLLVEAPCARLYRLCMTEKTTLKRKES